MVEFAVERTQGSCSFFVGFTTGQSNNFGSRQLTYAGNVLRYQLYPTASASSVLKDVPLAGNDEVLSGSVSPQQTRVTFQVVFLVPFQQIVPPGSYRDSVSVKVYEGTLQSPQLRAQSQLDLSVNVPTSAEFCLGTAVIFEAGYRNTCPQVGELTKGQVREVLMHTRSNSGYRVTLRSQNGGVMRNLDPLDNSTIPYDLTVDGQGVSLAGSQTVAAFQRMGLTSAFGDEHRLRFTIGQVDNASAGSYQDVIEITMYSDR